jgi:ribosomal protein S21
MRRETGLSAGEMAIFPRPVRPSRALSDLWGFLRARRRSEFLFGGLAVVITCLWFWMIFDKLSPKPEWRPPTVMYVKQWPKTRTAADVRAQQAIDAPREKAEREALEAAKKKRQDEYKRLAKQLGL